MVVGGLSSRGDKMVASISIVTGSTTRKALET